MWPILKCNGKKGSASEKKNDCNLEKSNVHFDGKEGIDAKVSLGIWLLLPIRVPFRTECADHEPKRAIFGPELYGKRAEPLVVL